MTQPESLKRTPLFDLHRELGAKIVPFAGYEMPVQYPAGIIAEHLHTRSAAGRQVATNDANSIDATIAT